LWTKAVTLLLTLATLPARATLHAPDGHSYVETLYFLTNRGHLTGVLVAKRAGHGDKRVPAPIRLEIRATSECSFDSNEQFTGLEFRIRDVSDFDLPGFD
jgi:hypothetical protein